MLMKQTNPHCGMGMSPNVRNLTIIVILKLGLRAP